MRPITCMLAAATLALGLGATAARAVTLDFLGFTDARGETAVEGFFVNDTIFDATHVPIAVTARGYKGSAAKGVQSDAYFAYLDRNQAGLGVCQKLSGSQCRTPSDDNLTKGEVLGLSFAQDITIGALSFRGDSHPRDPKFGKNDRFDFSLDGGLNWSSAALLNARFGESVLIDALLPKGTELLLAYNNQQYYLSAMTVETAPVPLPAAGALLVAALGGFGLIGAARRRRTA